MKCDEAKCYLTKEDINRIELLGVFSILIVKKDILKKNSDVGDFIEAVIGVKFPEYVIKSRTLMSARVNRILIAEEDDLKLKEIYKDMLDYLCNQEEKINQEENTYKKQKKKNENDKLKKWLKGL